MLSLIAFGSYFKGPTRSDVVEELIQVTLVNCVYYFPLPRCPTCVCAHSMRARAGLVPRAALVKCSYFDREWSATNLWCMGYGRASDSQIQKRVEDIKANGSYEEGV